MNRMAFNETSSAAPYYLFSVFYGKRKLFVNN